MSSDKTDEIDMRIKIQDTLVSINDVTSKIKRELDLIEELVKENGQLHTAVDKANETLSDKVHEMGLNVEKIIDEGRHKSRLESNLLDSITSVAITDKLMSHING